MLFFQQLLIGRSGLATFAGEFRSSISYTYLFVIGRYLHYLNNKNLFIKRNISNNKVNSYEEILYIIYLESSNITIYYIFS